MKEICVEAKIENVTVVTEFVEEILDSIDCPMKAKVQLDVAIDEIFSNIAYYAYGEDGGNAIISVSIEEDPRAVVLEFKDSGVQFDPLLKEDPDIELSAEERKIGGLGIFMVKKTMDQVDYEYKDGHNILRLKKIVS